VQENISVNKAIWNGRLTVIFPSLFILFAAIAIPFYMLAHGYDARIAVFTFVVCLLIGILYQSIAGAKWYVWAFSGVPNVHELKQRAIFIGLTTANGYRPFFISRKRQEAIKALEKRFDEQGVYIDDVSVPSVTKIYTPKAQSAFMLMVMLTIFIAGITLVFIAHLYLVGIGVCAVSGYFIFVSCKELLNDTPQMILSNEGIETTDNGFHAWQEIKNELIDLEVKQRQSHYFISYDFDGGNEKLYLYNLHISRHRLAKLIEVYQGRGVNTLVSNQDAKAGRL